MSAARKPRRSGISKDPFHAQVVAGLDHGSLDPACFQRSAADLLRDSYPNLVPITGSSDGGWDGAIADSQGEPVALVCTIGDVNRNLRKNLDSLRRGIGPPRRVVVATARRLTPGQRERLKAVAREKGFTLEQIFDQEAIADRLYHNPAWCKRLLGIAGTPSPLTSVPLSHRPPLEIELIGRDADVKWVRTTPGDLVIAGQPGAGKTHLLRSLIREGWDAQFLSRADQAAIADALRQQRPAVVIVDDADSDASPSRLEILAGLRLVHRFSIAATTWVGGQDQVVELLGGLPESHVRKLELLTRKQILEIIKQVGVEASEELLRELVDQSANRPGLAVTLATLWLQGSWKEVLEGTALSGTLVTRLRKLLNRDAEDILAAFSVGGEHGMHLGSVGEHLRMNLPGIRQSITDLAMAGVLSEINGGVLAVQPPQLRSALIRAVFFPDDLPPLPYRWLLDRAPSRDSAVEALIEAKARGAVIPTGELKQLVVQSDSRQNWAGFAQLGDEAAQWVIGNYPGDVIDVAASALLQAPRATIPRILKRAEERLGTAEDSHPDDPMGILTRWVQGLRISPQQRLERRYLLAMAAKKYLREGGNLGVGTEGIFLSLRPSVQDSRIDPGIGDTVTIRFGLLPLESLSGIRAIWEEVRDAIVEIDRSSWQHISAALWNWIYPEYAAKSAQVQEETKRFMRDFATQVLRELCPLAEGKPGVAAGLRALAARIGVDLPVAADPVFDLLYPEPDTTLEARHAREEASEEQPLKTLAALWAQQPPASVATKLAFYEREAETIGREWFRTAPEFCQTLAAAVAEPEAWLDAFLGLDRHGRLAAPFLEQIVKGTRSGWELQVARCLELKALNWSATSLVLQHPSPPESLLERAVEAAAALPTLVETLCLRREVPIPSLRLLLRLPQWETAAAAAIGEWQSDLTKTVRQEVAPEWREATLRAKTKDYRNASGAVGIQYWLGVILARDAELALLWLQARLGDSDVPSYFMGDSPFAQALRALSHGQRIQLLESLEPSPLLRSLLPLLIGNDAGLYERLVSIARLKEYHLEPLSGRPDEAWIRLAEIALKAGSDPSQIADTSFTSDDGFVGSGVEHWTQWDEAFAALAKHANDGLREVARHGRAMARAHLDAAQKRKKAIATHGLSGR